MTLVKYLLSLILVFCFVSVSGYGSGFNNNFWFLLFNKNMD